MAAPTQQLGPQTVGAAGGIVPFWAAAQDVVFDNFTSDTFTPAGSVVNMFQGSLAELKSYGFIKRLWLKFDTTTTQSNGFTYGSDSPANILDVLRITDPNGHAIVDADTFGLYLLSKYCGRNRNGEVFNYPNSQPSSTTATALGTALSTNAQLFEIPIPFCVNEELGLGALSDMDSSGPYKIIAQGAVASASGAHGLFSTTSTTSPVFRCQVGGEFFSLPGQASRVNGQPQVQLPPLLDRGIAVVNEFTKTTITSLSQGTRTYKIPRVGNILRNVILVARNGNGGRVAWTDTTNGLSSGTRISLSFDSIPLWDIDPQHAITLMMRRQARGEIYDSGVLVYSRGAPQGLTPYIEAGIDGGLDDLLQTAQNTSLDLTVNLAAAPAASTISSIDIYTSDITVTNMVTGEKYAFAYGGQLLLPSSPASIRS